MDILIVSKCDICRSRIAQSLLNSFGRGMKIYTAGSFEGLLMSQEVQQFLSEKNLDVSAGNSTTLDKYNKTSWNYVITLCDEAVKLVEQYKVETNHFKNFTFQAYDQSDAVTQKGDKLTEIYNSMFRLLYEFYRDEISEQLLPRCTCGANTYCRCE